MKNFKKRGYNSLDVSFLKNHNVQKKHKANVLAYENQIPIDWHQVKIILDATVVEKYLNNRKYGNTISPSNREKIFVQKIPRVNQNVFSENSNVMVKLEIPEDIGVDDNLSPQDSSVSDEVLVKQEDGILMLGSLDKNTFYNGEFIEPSSEDFQCQDRVNFTVEAALKNEVVESEGCYEGTIISQKFKDALKNEELFVGEEFKHEESIPSYEDVESIHQEDNEGMIKKKTRSSRKRKRCLDCNDCSHELEKRSRVPSRYKVVTLELPVQASKAFKFQTPSKPNKPKSSLRVDDRKTNDESLRIKSPGIHALRYCDHCDYKGRRAYMINHLRKKHEYLFPNNLVCSNCDVKFNSWEEMHGHRAVCLRFRICKFCLVNVSSARAMMSHMKSAHPKEIRRKKGERIGHKVCLNSMTDAMKTLKLTPFGQRYMEIRKYYLEIRSELIKLHCLKCEATYEKITIRRSTRCDSCASPLFYQCRKCKDTRTCYIDIWKHLTNKSSSCSIFNNSSLSDHGESSDVIIDQVASNETHNCGICYFKGTTRTHLYEHILNNHLDNVIIGNFSNNCKTCSKCGTSFRYGYVHFKRHEELCGIDVRFPCRFCPMTCYRMNHLFDHITFMHFDELDGRDMYEFLQEALDFKNMVRGMNTERFNEKLRNETLGTEKDYYHNGIKSMLKPVCIECKFDATQESAHCARCQASLNVVCLKCDELFSKYSVAWDHATRTCENRSFTLTVEKTCEGRTELDASTSNKKLLSCDRCNFKNPSKSILRNHIDRAHMQSRGIQGPFTCPKCYQNFAKASYFYQHRLWCRTDFEYACPFCDKTSPRLNVIEFHIKSYHAHDVRCQDTHEILQQVLENKKAHPTKPRNRFDKFGQIVKRTFAENIKLAIFHCPNCVDTVHKDFRYVSHTRKCPKCNGKLHVYCKMCNQAFFKWESIANHLRVTNCGGRMMDRELSIKTHELDHSYSLRQPPPQMMNL